MSHIIRKNPRGGNNAKSLETRQRFLAAYEQTCGNVSAASAAAGISRRTYYRWMNSPSRVNKKFQERLSRIKPDERLLDLAEAVLVQKLNDGDAATARYLLDRRGRSRGYGREGEELKPSPTPGLPSHPEKTLIEKVTAATRAYFERYDSVIETNEDRWRIVRRFAERGHVDLTELAKRVGLPQTDQTKRNTPEGHYHK